MNNFSSVDSNGDRPSIQIISDSVFFFCELEAYVLGGTVVARNGSDLRSPDEANR